MLGMIDRISKKTFLLFALMQKVRKKTRNFETLATRNFQPLARQNFTSHHQQDI